MSHASVIVIGAGPAGIAAAVQLKRQGLQPLLFERGEPGGLLRNANLVDNYPGFPEGIKGNALANRIQSHLSANDIRVIQETVIQVDWDGEKFSINSERQKYISDFLVIASGTAPIRLPEPEIPAELDNRFCYEVKDLFHVTAKDVVIIGGGDGAFDYALNLADRGNTIHILNRSDRTRCLSALRTKADNHFNINYFQNTIIKGIEPHEDRIRLLCMSEGKLNEIPTDYLLAAIGRAPVLDYISPENSELIKGAVDTGRAFLIGDVQNGLYRQTAIAVGDGIRVGMKIAQLIT